MTECQVAKEPDEIAKLVAHSAQLNMVSVKCFCSNSYAKYISCFVDVGHNNAPFLAKALGGYVLDNPRVSGHATVSFTLAISPDFCCSHRDENQVIRDGKCFCHSSFSKVNPKFLR